MQRNKEEVLNGTSNKETLVTPPKISKPPVERPYERKGSNATTNPDPVPIKVQPVSDGDIPVEVKVIKPKSPIGKIIIIFKYSIIYNFLSRQ